MRSLTNADLLLVTLFNILCNFLLGSHLFTRGRNSLQLISRAAFPGSPTMRLYMSCNDKTSLPKSSTCKGSTVLPITCNAWQTESTFLFEKWVVTVVCLGGNSTLFFFKIQISKQTFFLVQLNYWPFYILKKNTTSDLTYILPLLSIKLYKCSWWISHKYC